MAKTRALPFWFRTRKDQRLLCLLRRAVGLEVLVAEAGFAHHAPNPLLLVG
jgi:hypothetical protein